MTAPAHILVVGTGRMAHQLGQALARAGHVMAGVAGRDAAATARLAARLGTTAHALGGPMPPARLVLLAVSDDAIGAVAGRLPVTDAVVVHTSGAGGLDLLAPHPRRGVLWPVQSLVMDPPMDLAEVPLIVDAGTDADRDLLLPVARSVSRVVLALDLPQRERLHLAAVFTSNLPVFLVAEAQRMLGAMDLPADLLGPLWRTTAERVAGTGAREALTGPARRGDRATVQRHLALLADDPELARTYRLLSERIMRTYGHHP
ncbi:MAG: DUF2520 domain-containing protein [Flavobacteriales bacterium]|jgi:predicted short-subunit dehydrogenase-like oxidoreductase (DUF2520 family)|nr:DUF2520 domain-containing protein [Flavobacteriales bacterium]